MGLLLKVVLQMCRDSHSLLLIEVKNIMKKIFKTLTEFAAFVFVLAVSLNISSCTKVNAPSLYNPNLKN